MAKEREGLLGTTEVDVALDMGRTASTSLELIDEGDEVRPKWAAKFREAGKRVIGGVVNNEDPGSGAVVTGSLPRPDDGLMIGIRRRIFQYTWCRCVGTTGHVCSRAVRSRLILRMAGGGRGGYSTKKKSR